MKCLFHPHRVAANAGVIHNARLFIHPLLVFFFFHTCFLMHASSFHPQKYFRQSRTPPNPRLFFFHLKFNKSLNKILLFISSKILFFVANLRVVRKCFLWVSVLVPFFFLLALLNCTFLACVSFVYIFLSVECLTLGQESKR